MNVPDPNDTVVLHSADQPRARGSRSAGVLLKDIALFFAAPFVTIAYIALFPFIGLTMLVRANREARHSGKAAD